MVRTKREARRIGKLGKGKPKTFSDPERAIQQRRLAGIASGKARREKLAKIAGELQSVKARV